MKIRRSSKGLGSISGRVEQEGYMDKEGLWWEQGGLGMLRMVWRNLGRKSSKGWKENSKEKFEEKVWIKKNRMD